MSDTSNTNNSDINLPPDTIPPEFTDPFATEWDDDEMADNLSQWEDLLNNASTEHFSDIDRLGTMSQPEIDFIANLKEVPDPDTDGIEAE